MSHNEFIAHLVRRGVLRDPQLANGGLTARQGDGLGNLDWVGLTKLTASAFADELAAFCGCSRVQRGDLVGSQFAGAQLSARFLRDGHLFPYQDSSGNLMLAIARPTDGETVKAGELALPQLVTVTIATAEDVDAALATSL